MATENGHAASAPNTPWKEEVVASLKCVTCQQPLRFEKGFAECWACHKRTRLPQAIVVRGVLWDVPPGTVRSTAYEIEGMTGFWAHAIGGAALAQPGVMAWSNFRELQLVRCRRVMEQKFLRILGVEP